MTEEQIKQLHNRATNGEKLTSAELSALQNWYDENDRDEDLLLNQPENASNPANPDEELNKILAQISQSAAKVKRLARQNASIKEENETLRRAVENHLLEKAA